MNKYDLSGGFLCPKPREWGWRSWGTVGLDLLNSAHTLQLLGIKNESEHKNN